MPLEVHRETYGWSMYVRLMIFHSKDLPKDRLELRLDGALRGWLEQRAEEKNTTMTAVVVDLLERERAQDHKDPAQVERARLEAELSDVYKRIDEMEDSNDLHLHRLDRIAGGLRKAYPDLAWAQVRLKGLEDLNTEKKPEWARELKVRDVDIIEAVKGAEEYDHLMKRREEIKAKLKIFYAREAAATQT